MLIKQRIQTLEGRRRLNESIDKIKISLNKLQDIRDDGRNKTASLQENEHSIRKIQVGSKQEGKCYDGKNNNKIPLQKRETRIKPRIVIRKNIQLIIPRIQRERRKRRKDGRLRRAGEGNQEEHIKI